MTYRTINMRAEIDQKKPVQIAVSQVAISLVRGWRAAVRPLRAIGMAVFMFAAALAPPALAACGDVTVTGGTLPAVPGLFNPFAGSDTIEVPAGISINNAGSGNCNIAVAFFGTAAAPVMQSGANQLQYQLETTGGATLYSTNASPSAAQRIDTSVAGNSTITVPYRIRIPVGGANALVAPGSYADAQTSVRVYQRTGVNLGGLLVQPGFSATAEVDAVCELPTPTVTSLNFTSAITEGMPNPGVVLSTSFSNIRCNSPANLTLLGDALRRTPVGTAPSGFDNFINFHAASNFSGAVASLTTTEAVGDDSVTSSSPSSGATATGSMTVDINLVAGSTVLAGEYSSVLTVRLTPAP